MSDQTDAPTPEPTEPTNAPDHAQLAPEDDNPTSGESNRTIYLPQLLADEYGMSMSNARMTVGTGAVTLDGEPYEGDKMSIPYDKIAGKEVAVRSEVHSVRFTYNG